MVYVQSKKHENIIVLLLCFHIQYILQVKVSLCVIERNHMSSNSIHPNILMIYMQPQCRSLL